MIYYINELVNWRNPSNPIEQQVQEEIEAIRKRYFSEGTLKEFKIEHPNSRPKKNEATGYYEPKKRFTIDFIGGTQGEWRYADKLPTINNQGVVNFDNTPLSFTHYLALGEDKIELVWYLKHRNTQLAKGIIKEVDDEAVAKQIVDSESNDLDLRYALFGKQSPIANDAELLRDIAITFDIENARIIGVAQIKNRLYEHIKAGDKNKNKFVNSDMFLELAGDEDKRKVAKFIYDAVKNKDIAYSNKDYAWHLVEGGQLGEIILNIAGKDAQNATNILINKCIVDAKLRLTLYGFLGIKEATMLDEFRATTVEKLKQRAKKDGVKLEVGDVKEEIIEKLCKANDVLYEPL